MKNIIFAFALSLGAPPCAHAIIGGELAEDHSYNAVGMLHEAEGTRASCTATLIAERWIVTARHCMEGGSEEEPKTYKPQELHFRMGPKFAEPLQKSVALKRWLIPPPIQVKRDGKEETIEPDIVLAQLAMPIRNPHIKPIPLSIASLEPQRGSSLELVGFGATTTLGEGDFGVRKKAQMTLTAISDNVFLKIFGSEENFSRYLKQAFPGEEEMVSKHLAGGELFKGYTAHVWDPVGREDGYFSGSPKELSDSCYADSGGPLLHPTDEGLKLVGVISSGFPGATLSCVPLGTKVSTWGRQLQAWLTANHIPFEN